MPTYIITYDLNYRGQNYDCIHEKLNSYPQCWHMQGSAWIISTGLSASAIRDDLKKCLDENDELFIARLSGEAAWFGYNSEQNKWLKAALTNKLSKVA